MSTFERGHLLARSLACYERSEGLDVRRDLELVVVNDHSTDMTSALVADWSHRTGIRATVVLPCPKYVGWRDCGAVINAGIRASTGQYVLLTHPEVMVGRQSVATCVGVLASFESGRYGHMEESIRQYPFGPYACCRVYYLSPRDQERLDTVPWKDEGVLAVRQVAGFYDEDANGNPDYTHRATDVVAQPGSRLPTWESWVFGGMSRETWKRLGGMLETQAWGSVDVAFRHRRQTLGIPNHTCPGDDTIVLHQNHDRSGDVPTDRDMNAWVKELKDFPLNDATKLVYPQVDFI